MICKICDSPSEQLFNGRIRNGAKGLSKNEATVYKCQKCKVGFLESQESLSLQDYQSNDYHEKFQYMQTERSKKILEFLNFSSNSSIIDIGAGAGQLINEMNEKFTTCSFFGLEPSKELSGSNIFNNFDEIKDKFHYATNINVIEHVDDPLEHLRSIHSLLHDQGKLYIMTPNSNDYNLTLFPKSFSQHFYRTAHRWYFNEESLLKILIKTKFKIDAIEYVHFYNVENIFKWAEKEYSITAQARPTSPLINENFIKLIKDNKLSSHIMIRVQKNGN